jgi:hypothetical protein
MLEFKTEKVTVQAIITQRVTREVEEYNNQLPPYFRGLVEPQEAEATQGGCKPQADEKCI